MSYEPLHHKYRPQSFADLVGQEAIATTLTNAIVNHKIAPAYLFTGPRGTGKTSSARILAKSLNCLGSDRPTATPCGQCEVCLAIARATAMDVIEIDAASNTGVDNIREIIERAQFAPVQCRYKVYAIDECHMLSTAAFNALLKTLEEPPARVVFVLATTDPQRVLPTIISRCQRFDYRRIPIKAMVSHLQWIAQQEKIDITSEAITLVGQIANGGLRDAQSLLDQLSLFSGTITPERVWDLVGAVPEQDLLTLLQAIRNNKVELVLQQCRHLLDRGREPLVILQNLASFYLNLLIAKTSPSCHDLVALTEPTWQQLCVEANNWDLKLILHGQQHLKDSEAQVKNTTQPRLWLEITLLGLLPAASGHLTLRSHAVNSEKEHQNFPQRLPIEQNELSDTNAKHLTSTEQISSVEKDFNSATKPQSDRAASLPAKQEPLSALTSEPDSQANPPSLEIPKQDLYPSPSVNSNNLDRASVVAQTSPTHSEVKTSTNLDRQQNQAIANSEPKIDSELIWQKVVASAHPPITQVLLRQHCHLLDWRGHTALIGISSPQLLKLNQNKIPNIEAAFAKVCGHKVKVTLEVASAESQSITSTQTSVSPEPKDNPTIRQSASTVIISPKPETLEYSNEHPGIPTPPATKIPVAVNQIPQSPETIAEVKETKKLEVTVQSPATELKQNEGDRQENDSLEDLDFNKALESLSKSFEGEIVELLDRADKYIAKTQPPEEEEDIPF
jgi:DNA polymerase-3 subunit gamma/tau